MKIACTLFVFHVKCAKMKERIKKEWTKWQKEEKKAHPEKTEIAQGTVYSVLITQMGKTVVLNCSILCCIVRVNTLLVKNILLPIEFWLYREYSFNVYIIFVSQFFFKSFFEFNKTFLSNFKPFLHTLLLFIKKMRL